MDTAPAPAFSCRTRPSPGSRALGPEPVAEAIQVGTARHGTAWFAEHGIGAETCLFGLDGSDEAGVVVTAALRARRRTQAIWEQTVVST